MRRKTERLYSHVDSYSLTYSLTYELTYGHVYRDVKVNARRKLRAAPSQLEGGETTGVEGVY
ncbi:uncharacterized protein BDZ99DRAFT_457770, partial [Mytilinidion resinicola]